MIAGDPLQCSACHPGQLGGSQVHLASTDIVQFSTINVLYTLWINIELLGRGCIQAGGSQPAAVCRQRSTSTVVTDSQALPDEDPGVGPEGEGVTDLDATDSDAEANPVSMRWAVLLPP